MAQTRQSARPSPPRNFTLTSVSVSWSGTAGATYEVLRQSAGGMLSTLGSSTNGSWTDNTAAAGTAYLYKVRAIAPAMTPYGAAYLATTVIFTDPTLTAGLVVKASHFTELRTAVNAVRVLSGPLAFSFTDSLTPGSTLVRAIHLTQLRTVIDDARASLLLPSLVYATPAINPGISLITAEHINELRIRVR